MAAAFMLLCLILAPAKAFGDNHLTEAALWEVLRDGEAFAIMRHTLAPGTGDPNDFDVNDCTTQRNLNSQGREQAQRIGQRFRDNGIPSAEVVSSQWCRCRETAELLDLGPVNVFQALNSFFQQHHRREAQTAETRDWLASKSINKPLVLVTHQVNISALLDEFTSSGEFYVVSPAADGKMTILGSIQTNP